MPLTAAAFSTLSPLAIRGVSLDSLTISADIMPGHYVARAVICDLQPSQMGAAIVSTMDAVRTTYRFARSTGWRGASDGLTIWFAA